MPIYSNIASTLARQGPKSFTHGYAQSLVAATHPQAFVSNNRPGFGLNRRTSKVGSHSVYHFQNAFHSSAGSSNSVQQVRVEKNDAGLDAYFEAWKTQHVAGEPEKEWTQYQFAKRIEWTPSSVDVDNELHMNLEVEEAAKPALDRAYSESAVQDLKKAEFLAAEEAGLAAIDAALEKEIKLREDRAIFEAELSIVASRVPTPPAALSRSQTPSQGSASFRSPATSATTVSSAAELQSQSYAEHLSKLAAGGRYAEVPAVFEAMLVAGIQPTAIAYNALLDAAVNLPAERIQVVPKALDVYTDMMKRGVSPNTASYNTLVTLLSARAIEVETLKQSLEDKRVRFGGMEEVGKFMFASSELELAILGEDDRLDLALRMFRSSIIVDRSYPAETYNLLITACSGAGKIDDMNELYAHMTKNQIIPRSSTIESMIKGYTQTGDLKQAVERYDEYKNFAVQDNEGQLKMDHRSDAKIYASLVNTYVQLDKMDGAMKFYHRVLETYPDNTVYLHDEIVSGGFVDGLIARGKLTDAYNWAETIHGSAKVISMSKLATLAADADNIQIALPAFLYVLPHLAGSEVPVMAMLAFSVRAGDVPAAQRYWEELSKPEANISASFIEPTAMYAVAMIGSGQVAEGLTEAENMFARIRASADVNGHLNDEIEEGVHFINRFMSTRGLSDPRQAVQEIVYPAYPVAYQAAPTYEDTFDPYAASTDFKGSAIIAEELEKAMSGRNKASKLTEALGRFRNMRRAGRHPRYITYAKLISAAAREDRMALVNDILGMARSDIPLLPQYQVVRYGWVSILDAMVGACLTLGNRVLAAQYHQELLDMGTAPTANTFGLYITTLKESTRTFDEASEAVKIFHRAKTEGVEPSSFLYNALIGKLGKARRIDDCLFYFAEMRGLGIRPTSVTYGTIVNALCRVSDEKFAEELFEEMESMPNYKARPAPYNSLMQFFLTTKRDKGKVLAYFERMKAKHIEPTNHTYKLLVDTHATLEPVNMEAAEAVLDVIRRSGQQPEAVHYSSLIHAKGCVLHDMEGAKAVFDSVMADRSIRPQACLFQALFESMVANHKVTDTEPVLREMAMRGVDMTPYIANTLIHGWANESNIEKCKAVFATLGREKREPSTYEAMTRAYLAVEDRASAERVVKEMLGRGYPGAVSNKICELLGGGGAENAGH